MRSPRRTQLTKLQLLDEANKVALNRPRKKIIKDSNWFGRCITRPSEAEVQRLYEEDLDLVSKWFYDIPYHLDLYWIV